MAVNHGGLATVVTEDNGWLLPPTVASWAEALSGLTTSQLCRRGEAARRTFQSRFDEAVTTRQLVAAYDELLVA
jgi:glycosyltransferase involved in cell wall biosynthesis